MADECFARPVLAMAKPTILLVDADPRSQHVVELSLQKAGYEVVCEADGERALEVMNARRCDLVITERILERSDGFSLLARLRADPAHSAVPVVFLTAERSISERQRALELGAADYVIKPLAVRELLERLAKVVETAYVSSPPPRPSGSAPQSAEDPDIKTVRTRFAGSTRDMAVVDLIQTFEVSRKSGEIRINAGTVSGSLWIRDGKVIDAEAGRLSGEDAVYRLLVLQEADFQVHFGAIEREVVIEASTAALLMEGLRRADEWHRLVGALPALSSIVRVDAKRLVGSLSQIPDGLNTVLRLCDGRRSIADVLDASPFDDLSTLSTVAKLLEEGVIGATSAPVVAASAASFAPSAPSAERSSPLSEDGWTPRGTLRVPSGTMVAADGNDDASELLANALTPPAPLALLEPDPHDALTVPAPVAVESGPRTLPVPQHGAIEPHAAKGVEEASVPAASDVEATEPTLLATESEPPSLPVATRFHGRNVVAWFAGATLGAAALIIAARNQYRCKYDTKEGLELRPPPISIESQAAASVPSTEASPKREIPEVPASEHAPAPSPEEPGAATAAAAASSLSATKARPSASSPEAPRVMPQPAAPTVASPRLAAREASPRASAAPPAPPASIAPSGVSADAMTQEARKSLDGTERDDRQRTRAVQLAFLATQEDPSNAEAWLTLGAAYEAIGKRQQALESYRSCARRSASHPRVAECKVRAGIKD